MGNKLFIFSVIDTAGLFNVIFSTLPVIQQDKHGFACESN